MKCYVAYVISPEELEAILACRRADKKKRQNVTSWSKKNDFKCPNYAGLNRLRGNAS
jgi:hypothetical protein